MLAKTYSYGLTGLEAYPICIEVDVSLGLPATNIVGLPDSAIKESRERVRSAIRNNGYAYLPRRVTVNLSPADTKKAGPSFDLAIALGILAASEQISIQDLDQYAILGELSLDGRIQAVSGALPIALSLDQKRFKGLIVPLTNAREAAVCENTKIFPVRSLKEVIYFLQNPQSIPAHPCEDLSGHGQVNHDIDFKEVKGQAHAKRGLEIAAGGGHNVLLIGPPGSGKSMLAKRLPTILPLMEKTEAIETTKIHSVMGLLKPEQGLLRKRPFRSPHHTTSDIALVGGGSLPRPGEVTLAHNGVLFLDELPEFSRNVLETLRQPLEDHSVTIARANKTLCFPSRFILIAAMNPCPCGQLTNSRKTCHCSPIQIQKYLSKISGPLLDRIDIHLDVPSLPSSELLNYPPAETSAEIKERILIVRQKQQERFAGAFFSINAAMTTAYLKSHCVLDAESQELLRMAIEELGLSARAHDKVLKVARTIADLDGKENIQSEHIAEAIQYRSLDRNWWG